MKKTLFVLLILLVSCSYAQDPLVRRSNLGDSTAAIRALINSYDTDSANVKSIVSDSVAVERTTRTDLINAIPASISDSLSDSYANILKYDGWFYNDLTTGMSNEYLLRNSGTDGEKLFITDGTYKLAGFDCYVNTKRDDGYITLKVYLNGVFEDSLHIENADPGITSRTYVEGWNILPTTALKKGDYLQVLISTDINYAPTGTDVTAIIKLRRY
jgi:hypothetical protein